MARTKKGESRQEANLACLPGTQITTCWELVDAQTAQEYRAKVGRQRHFMLGLAKSYQSEMTLEQWQTTHQGIAFSENDELVDGLHRCEAIIASGRPQWLLVTRGLPEAAIEAMDRGRNRTLAHYLQIMGQDLANNRAVAMARSMHAGPGYKRGVTRPSLITLRKFMEDNREALVFVSALPTYSSLKAAVTGLLARAYRHVAPAELERFVLAMQDAIPLKEQRPGDATARALAKTIERTMEVGGTGRSGLYRKTQNALRHYLERTDVKRLDALEEDLYPLEDNPTPTVLNIVNEGA